MSGEKRQFLRARKPSHSGRPKQRHRDFSHGQHRGWTPGPEGHGSKQHKENPRKWVDCSLCGTPFQTAAEKGKAVYCKECLDSFEKYKRRRGSKW